MDSQTRYVLILEWTSWTESLYFGIFAFQEFYSTAQDVMSIHKHLLAAFNQNFRIELPFENTLEFDSEVYFSLFNLLFNAEMQMMIFYYHSNASTVTIKLFN